MLFMSRRMGGVESLKTCCIFETIPVFAYKSVDQAHKLQQISDLGRPQDPSKHARAALNLEYPLNLEYILSFGVEGVSRW